MHSAAPRGLRLAAGASPGAALYGYVCGAGSVLRPGYVGLSCQMVQMAGQHEQQVAQTVHEPQGVGCQRLLWAVHGQHAALGSAGHCADACVPPGRRNWL